MGRCLVGEGAVGEKFEEGERMGSAVDAVDEG